MFWTGKFMYGNLLETPKSALKVEIFTCSGLRQETQPQETSIVFCRSAVHRDGDFHRAVHIWIFAESTKELLLQKRSDDKDSWAGLWDISSAGHISAGDASLNTARRELQEELGVNLPADAFEFLFVYLQQS
jgi:isopentenyldiphosphate isomerase